VIAVRLPRKAAALLAPLLLALGACQAAPPTPPLGDDGTGAAGLDAPVPGLRAIGAVQGHAAASPLLDQQVSVRGVVVGNFASGLQGVFVQSEHDDGDPATAEGILVARTPEEEPKLRTGDRVQVSGRVVETGDAGASMTTLRDAVVSVLGHGEPAPTVLRAPPADWERYEGMLLRIDAPLVVSGNESVASYGEIATAFGERLFQPTELAPPGPQAQAIAQDNARRALLLDDARASKDPRNLWFLPQGLTASAPLRAGSLLTGTTGVLDQRRGDYRLQLTEKLQVREAPRPQQLPPVRGKLRIASLNMHNLFNGDGHGGGFPTERGAATREEYQRQLAKLVGVVQAMQPDIAVMMEVENDGSGADSTLVQLVEALNAAGPVRDYRWIDTGASLGNDAIHVAMIYRASAATPVGKFATLLDGPFANRSRSPLTQLFQLPDGERLQLTAVHFKSKGCGREPDQAQGADADQHDGQGCWNPVRVDSVRRVADWLARDPLGAGKDTPRLMIGDFNAYAQEDPMRALYAAGWQDAFALEGKRPRPYSFVFDGAAGRHDHALADAGMRAHLRSAEEWHINADEADFFDPRNADSPGPWRASDHDPILLGLDFQR
jgi:predicted extracellular nuclease